MGGCYGTGYGYSDCSRTQKETDEISTKGKVTRFLNKFWETGDIGELVKAQVAFFNLQDSGFFARIAESRGISDVTKIPKEFPEIEYEIKFDIIPTEGKGKEPSVKDYLDAFDFPAVNTPRFLKDPINSVSIGVNNFYGCNREERLVVIEKGGGLYAKEKGPVLPLETSVQFQDLVIKRTEERHQASHSEIQERIQEIMKEGAVYQGKIRKEKGDAFVFDTSDGRLYSMTFTRSHLIKPGESKESAIQRQLELEYAGYIPKVNGFKINSEQQIVQGMVDLAKYIAVVYSSLPIRDGWRANVRPTSERKYDFIIGRGYLPQENTRLLAQLPLRLGKKSRTKELR